MLILFIILSTLFSVNINCCYSQSGIITGRVYSQSTKATLENAKLILKRNNRYHKKTKTDHVGNYWFGDLKAGTYSVWVLQDDYCQLEMDEIKLDKNSSIQLDLGLMENAKNTNVTTNSKVYMVYHAPISMNLDTTATAYEDFKNEIHIISEVYQGYEIRIAPKRKPDPVRNSRATHYNESLKGLEKTSSFARTGL